MKIYKFCRKTSKIQFFKCRSKKLLADNSLLRMRYDCTTTASKIVISATLKVKIELPEVKAFSRITKSSFLSASFHIHILSARANFPVDIKIL